MSFRLAICLGCAAFLGVCALSFFAAPDAQVMTLERGLGEKIEISSL